MHHVPYRMTHEAAQPSPQSASQQPPMRQPPHQHRDRRCAIPRPYMQEQYTSHNKEGYSVSKPSHTWIFRTSTQSLAPSTALWRTASAGCGLKHNM
mmetsp:Transcript_107897/g.182495  ORF Transcript_107897/g.182495 Transcript_107897/m.182495 type:complete len:96 (+) Transcript_107897:401-688(+)